MRVACNRGSKAKAALAAARHSDRSRQAWHAKAGQRQGWQACQGESRRAARALSSGSASFRATGVTSEEPTVKGTRGDPIGVIVSLWRYLAQIRKGQVAPDIGCISELVG